MGCYQVSAAPTTGLAQHSSTPLPTITYDQWCRHQHAHSPGLAGADAALHAHSPRRTRACAWPAVASTSTSSTSASLNRLHAAAVFLLKMQLQRTSSCRVVASKPLACAAVVVSHGVRSQSPKEKKTREPARAVARTVNGKRCASTHACCELPWRRGAQPQRQAGECCCRDHRRAASCTGDWKVSPNAKQRKVAVVI